MNRLEMAAKLFENPKLRAKNNFNEIVKVYKYGKSGLMEIEYESTKEVLNLSLSDESWKIIEPERKLKEFCFGEVYYYYIEGWVKSSEIKSVVTGLHYDRVFSSVSLKELFKGKWTIDGYYEEDENE